MPRCPSRLRPYLKGEGITKKSNPWKTTSLDRSIMGNQHYNGWCSHLGWAASFIKRAKLNYIFRDSAIGRTRQGTGKRLLTRHLEMLGVLPTNVRNLQIPMESIFGVFSKNNLNKKVKPDRASQNWQKINLTLPSHLIRL